MDFLGGSVLYGGPNTGVCPFRIHSKHSSFRDVTVDHTIFLHGSTIATLFESIYQRGRRGLVKTLG
ncbi:MAG: hypothetical protein QFX35_02810 [Candidatus Verstraetearchaeota archaeon]|nr:hypothetical protein [Candidatus Verstraetearchaeota archaeon]